MTTRWERKQQGETVWLTCELLKDFPHGFFTRQGAQTPTQCAVSLGLKEDRAHALHQVHSALFHTAPLALQTPGDALGTAESEVSVWVASADCVPILVATPHFVAAIHAGWRGTAQEILPLTLNHLQGLGIAMKDVRIAIGPAISGARYPVGADVALQVLQTIGQTEATPTLNLKAINFAQACGSGVLPEHIAISPHCTFDTPELFYSYRRDGKSGIQRSGIALPQDGKFFG